MKRRPMTPRGVPWIAADPSSATPCDLGSTVDLPDHVDQETAVAATEIQALARDKLRLWRHGLRGELRGLPKCLGSGERVLSMGTGISGTGNAHGACLIVATDRRLLLLSKVPLRPLRCDELSYGRLTSVSVDETSKNSPPALVLTYGAAAQSWQVRPQARTAELAKLAAERIGGEVPIEGLPTAAQTKRSPRTPAVLALGWLIGAVVFVVSVFAWFDIAPLNEDAPNQDAPLEAGQCLGVEGEPLPCSSEDAVFKTVDRAGRDCPLSRVPEAYELFADYVLEAESRGLCIDFHVPPRSRGKR
jgi:hypothetical protein